MRKDLKNRVQICTSIKNELNIKLSELSKITRINKSKLIDEAIELLLEKHSTQE